MTRSVVSIPSSRVLELLESDVYCMQEKLDGRRLILKKDRGVMFLNKRLQTTAGPDWLKSAAEELTGDGWILDGELYQDQYHIFELVQAPDQRVELKAFDQRLSMLQAIVHAWDHPKIHVVQTWFNTKEKFASLLQLRNLGAEGVVFRSRRHRRTYQGVAYKFKFYETVDCYVSRKMVDKKQAVACAVVAEPPPVQPTFDDAITEPTTYFIGNCGVPERIQRDWPDYQVIEVRHRGLSKPLSQGGRMVEPIFIRTRDDKPAYECTADQLRVRAEPRNSGDTPPWRHDSILTKIGISRQQFLDIVGELHGG